MKDKLRGVRKKRRKGKKTGKDKEENNNKIVTDWQVKTVKEYGFSLS